jgi:hypothetical protein
VGLERGVELLMEDPDREVRRCPWVARGAIVAVAVEAKSAVPSIPVARMAPGALVDRSI